MREKMIDLIIEKIPTRNISHQNFPYLQNYYDYIIRKIAEISNINLDDINKPILEIKDTPYFESHILSYKQDNRIVFDISTSYLIIAISKTLMTGKITKKTWVLLLEALVETMLSMGYESVAISFAINKIQQDVFDLEKDVLFTLDDPVKFMKAKEYGSYIKCQEMYILAHEVIHYFISQGVISTDITDEILKNLNNTSDLSSSVFLFNVTNGNIEDNTTKRISDSFKSTQTKEEIVCDILAFSVTTEYFNWDASSQNSLTIEKINTSIYLTMDSLLLVLSLKNRLIDIINGFYKESHKKLDVIQMIVRKKVIEGYCSINMGNSSMEELFSAMAFSVSKDLYSKRAVCIDKIFSKDLLMIIAELKSNSIYMDMFFLDIKNSAFYYLGFDNKTTKATNFKETDGSIINEMSDITRECFLENIETNIFNINEKTLSNAKKFMIE